MKRKIKYEEENKKTKRNLKKETIINDDKYKRYNNKKLNVEILQTEKGITLLVLVVTIVLNCSYLAMDRINKIEKI